MSVNTNEANLNDMATTLNAERPSGSKPTRRTNLKQLTAGSWALLTGGCFVHPEKNAAPYIARVEVLDANSSPDGSVLLPDEHGEYARTLSSAALQAGVGYRVTVKNDDGDSISIDHYSSTGAYAEVKNDRGSKNGTRTFDVWYNAEDVVRGDPVLEISYDDGKDTGILRIVHRVDVLGGANDTADPSDDFTETSDSAPDTLPSGLDFYLNDHRIAADADDAASHHVNLGSEHGTRQVLTVDVTYVSGVNGDNYLQMFRGPNAEKSSTGNPILTMNPARATYREIDGRKYVDMTLTPLAAGTQKIALGFGDTIENLHFTVE